MIINDSITQKGIDMDPVRKLKCILFVVVFMLIFGVFVSKINADELCHYDMYGQNKSNGLMVVAKVWESDKQGNLKGKVWDEITVQDQCNGTWVGYGVAQLGCGNGVQYVLRVVEK